MNALVFGADGGTLDGNALERFRSIRDRIDEAFTAWIRQRFETLHNLPPSPPVMIHQIPRLLARRLQESRGGRVALVVMDGLALDQWVVVHELLAQQRPELRFREESLFAWIPTLTMVSRQACFAGRPPLYFAPSIDGTDREPSAWKRFWGDEGLSPVEAVYEKNLRDPADVDRVEELVSHPGARAVGLVVDAVDRIMHGMSGQAVDREQSVGRVARRASRPRIRRLPDIGPRKRGSPRLRGAEGEVACGAERTACTRLP